VQGEVGPEQPERLPDAGVEIGRRMPRGNRPGSGAPAAAVWPTPKVQTCLTSR
jgi:hypothetical protein